MKTPAGRTWGVWDKAANRWRHDPSLAYPATVRALQLESERSGFNLLELKQGKIEVEVAKPEPLPAERLVTDDLQPSLSAKAMSECTAALKVYVAVIERKRCCSIERGPARDRFGVFAVLRIDGGLTLRSWDRESSSWY